jgi:hypothetical protein
MMDGKTIRITLQVISSVGTDMFYKRVDDMTQHYPDITYEHALLGVVGCIALELGIEL